MTAYIDRLRMLTGGQLPLRARPRSRFEPAPPGSEPPWERSAPDSALPPLEIDDVVQARPGAAPCGAALPTDPAGRPAAAPAVPADSHPDAAAAPPRSGPAPRQPPGLSRSPSAPVRPEPPPAPVQARPRGAQADLPPPPGPGEPPAVIRPASPARQAPADRAEAASGHVRLARLTARTDGLSHRGERRSAPPGEPGPLAGLRGRPSVPAGAAAPPAGSGPGSKGSAQGDRSAAWPAVTATRARRSGTSQEPDVPAAPDQPALPTDRARGTASTLRREAADAAVPYRGRLPAPGDRTGAAEPADGDPAITPRPGHPGAGRRTAAAAQPDEVTVTIGCVEVRVGPPPSPAAVTSRGGGTRPSRPQPSRLDEYLRARAAGRVG